MINGIDVSHYQGNIDWSKFDQDFALIKVTEGTTYVDPMWFSHNKEVVKRGIAHGFYHFLRGGDAIAEANFFASKLGSLDQGEILMIDFEVALDNPVPYCLEFAKQLAARFNGLRALIYMSESVVLAHDWQPLVDYGCGLAVAKYGTNTGQPQGSPKTGKWPFWAIWQYTSKGRVNGVSTDVDRDQFNGTKEQFLKYGYQLPITTTTTTTEATTTTTTTIEPLPEPTTTTTTTIEPSPEPTTTTTTTLNPAPPNGDVMKFFVALYNWLKDWFSKNWQ